MSTIPFILNLDSQPYYGHNVFPNRMYRRLHPRQHDLLDFPTLAMIARLGPHAHHLSAKRHGAISNLSADNKAFEVNLDVGLFQPNELTVKLSNDYVVVEGKHEEREDEHGHISRHIVRRYKLPKGYDPDVITSSLTTDGVLTIRVPKPEPHEDSKGNERVIQIHQSGPSDLFVRSASNSIESDDK